MKTYSNEKLQKLRDRFIYFWNPNEKFTSNENREALQAQMALSIFLLQESASYNEEDLHLLSEEDSPYLRVLVLQRKLDKIPLEILERLAVDASSEVRLNVARKIEDTEMMKLFVDDPDEFVRSKLAENICLPRSIMETLSNDTSERVRICLAANPALAQNLDILEKLFAEVNENIHHSISMNPATPERILRQNMDDSFLFWNPALPLTMKMDLYESSPGDFRMLQMMALMSGELPLPYISQLARDIVTFSDTSEHLFTWEEHQSALSELFSDSPQELDNKLLHLPDTEEEFQFFIQKKFLEQKLQLLQRIIENLVARSI